VLDWHRSVSAEGAARPFDRRSAVATVAMSIHPMLRAEEKSQSRKHWTLFVFVHRHRLDAAISKEQNYHHTFRLPRG
jgi:uncharacterized NAD(P)/FAD-binding protein YdhS